MSDINAALSSTEQAVPMTDAEHASLPDWVKNGQPPAQEAASATGEPTGIPAIPSATGNAATDAAAPSTSTTAAQVSAEAAASTIAIPTGDAGNGTGAASAATATSTSNAADFGDAGIAAADLGNAAALLAGGQSASGTASSALGASLGDDTEVAALRAELDDADARLSALQQQLTDANEVIANLQQQLTPVRQPGELPAAHRWISLLEVKLSDLEHDARDELLDVARQLREAL